MDNELDEPTSLFTPRQVVENLPVKLLKDFGSELGASITNHFKSDGLSHEEE